MALGVVVLEAQQRHNATVEKLGHGREGIGRSGAVENLAVPGTGLRLTGGVGGPMGPNGASTAVGRGDNLSIRWAQGSNGQDIPNPIAEISRSRRISNNPSLATIPGPRASTPRLWLPILPRDPVGDVIDTRPAALRRPEHHPLQHEQRHPDRDRVPQPTP